MTKKVKTGIVDFDDLSLDEVAGVVRRLATEKTPSYVVTPNMDHLSRLVASGRAELVDIYHQADLVLCDSRIVQKLLRLAVGESCHVVAGSDLTKHLFDQVLTSNDAVMIIGGEAQVIDQLRQRHPQLTLRHVNPSMGFIKRDDEVAALVAQIKACDPDVVLLGVGSPQQEILAAKLKTAGVGGVSLCIGASILFLVGAERRAPTWMQWAHMEWLYRMLQNPRRLIQRYAANALSMPKIVARLGARTDS